MGDLKVNKALRLKIVEMADTQKSFAKRLGVCDSIVSAVVRGRRNLSRDEKAKWAQELGVKVGDVFEEE